MNNKDDLKSLYLALILSVIVVMSVNYFFPKPKVTPQAVQTEVQTPVAETEDVQKNEAQEIVFSDKKDVLTQDSRLPIKNNNISGSIRLKGVRFDDVLLTKYKQSIADDSPAVELLSPSKTENAFFAEYGWLSSDENLPLPNAQTLWQLEKGDMLTPDTPVRLTWDNGQGVKFIYDIALDEHYLFDIKQTVENNTDHAISLIPYGLISKYIDPNNLSRSVVHEGFTGIIDGKLQEVKYPDIEEAGKKFETTGGWISFSDKYWFGAFVFNPNYKSDVHVRKIKEHLYQLDFKGLPMQLQAGSSSSVNTRFYAGAKEIRLLDNYAKDIEKFDLAVDFGWYYFITKPFFYILDFLYRFIGNMGWAILLFAALLRLLMFPVANKSYESMSKMKKIQPQMTALQEKYKDDKVALQRATMELYQREKVNPASGCLPMFIQIPIFFSLYKVLNIAIEIRHAPFIGWVKDLSAPDPLTLSSWTHLWVPSALDIGVWPLIYGVTMYIQMKLNPKPANKDQARMFALMPIVFTIMFAHFAVGLVIYWTLSNILSIIQQRVIMHKNGVK
ncbi:MAG: membrane protein insertase YidC [Alphaproteobacteria bacterium]|nr:membrane protein insertase YidC [Alphaproteobacteria bacterium]